MKLNGKNTKLILTSFNIFILLFCFVFCVNAQDMRFGKEESRSFKVGLTASPNGVGPMFRYTINYGQKFSRMLDINFTGIKHVKEKLILNQRMANATPYFYGKVNRFYALRPMVGLHKQLSERSSKNGIGINCFIGMGPSFGFLKPNFVDIEMLDPNIPNSYITTSIRYQPELIDNESIIGYSSFDKGIGQTKMNLGLSMKLGTEFNWGMYSSGYKSLELGLMVDVFPSRPTILYNIKNKLIFSSFYISFALGESS